MTKKIQRRFLFLAIMLLMTLSLIGSGSRQQAAARQTCEECIDDAQWAYITCTDFEDTCRRRYNWDVSFCYYNGYCSAP